MKPSPADGRKIKEILLRGNYVSSADMKKAEKFAETHRAPIEEYLLTEGIITKDLLGQAVAESFGIAYADLNSLVPSREQVLKVPEAIAKKYRVVLFREDENSVVLATDNPEQENIIEELKRFLKKPKEINLAFSLPEDIDATLTLYSQPLEARFIKIIQERKKVAPEIIDEVFSDALTFRASDVHFEPREEEVVIRFRIDGVLREVGRISKEYYENILNSVKVRAYLRIDEHFSAQDGAMRYAKGGKSVDLRVSVAPTIDGEKMVIRLLAEYVRGFTLADLGLSERDQKLLSAAASKPFGMIIVSGPAGSGKSTTAYSILRFLNRPEVNIATIEDPVEYKVPGVNHIQVNPRTNLTFAKGLRSIARQDPDIILVGEIRDGETAEIAVNIALTGHLLLSTFHANDAATAVPRLLDMNIEPFLLASTLEAVVAQRLVRRICENCRYGIPFNRENLKELIIDAEKYFPEKTMTLYRGKGCAVCGFSGYRGRVAIFEFIKITPEMQDLILTNPTTRQVWELAREQGARSLFEDGAEKVKLGITTIEELLRVAPPPRFS